MAVNERILERIAPALPYLAPGNGLSSRAQRSALPVDRPEEAERLHRALRDLLVEDAGLRAASLGAVTGSVNGSHELLVTRLQRALVKNPTKAALAEEMSASGDDITESEAAADGNPRPDRITPTAVVLAVVALLLGLSVLIPEASLGRSLRLFVIAFLSFFPPWLFARFIKLRAGALWAEYVLNLHRLGMDEPQHLPRPPASSIYFDEWRDRGGPQYHGQPNIYRQKFIAYYGRSVAGRLADGDISAKGDGTHLPLYLSTAVFAVGWIAVFQNWSALFRVPSPGEPASTYAVLAAAFLGSYTFIIQMLIRRFYQADLKSSAYIGGIVRIISVLIIVSVLHVGGLAPTTGAEIVAAFVIGFFPLAAMQFLQKTAAVGLKMAVPSLQTDYPLSDLDGLSVWYEARLLEEGIEDLQNLTTANFVDVLLHTRVPVGRLVDWIDQAHLFLHMEPERRGRRKNGLPSHREKLRRHGIRTASDLCDVFRSGQAGEFSSVAGEIQSEEDRDLRRGLRWILNDKPEPPSVTQAILKAFGNDPNLVPVRNWKKAWTREAEEAERSRHKAHAGHAQRLSKRASLGARPQAPSVPETTPQSPSILLDELGSGPIEPTTLEPAASVGS